MLVLILTITYLYFDMLSLVEHALAPRPAHALAPRPAHALAPRPARTTAHTNGLPSSSAI